MNGLDWTLFGVCLFCVARGMWRGAVSQVFGIVGVFGGFWAASHYYEGIAQQLSQAFPKLEATSVISFITLFLLTWFCLAVVGFWLTRLLHRGGLGLFDRLFGASLGVLKAAVLAIIMISMLTFFLSPENSLLVTSALAPHVQGIAQVAVKSTPQSVQQMFDRKRAEFERYWLDYKKMESQSKNMKKGVNVKQ